MKVIQRFNGFSLWAKLIVYIALAALAIGIAVRAGGAFKYLIFGNTEAKQAQGQTIVAEEQGWAAKETGIEATATAVRRQESHAKRDRVVREGQDAINRADRGQQMDPAIDAAVADGLCRVHDSLCRRGEQRQVQRVRAPAVVGADAACAAPGNDPGQPWQLRDC
jgi:hypothetical protein